MLPSGNASSISALKKIYIYTHLLYCSIVWLELWRHGQEFLAKQAEVFLSLTYSEQVATSEWALHYCRHANHWLQELWIQENRHAIPIFNMDCCVLTTGFFWCEIYFASQVSNSYCAFFKMQETAIAQTTGLQSVYQRIALCSLGNLPASTHLLKTTVTIPLWYHYGSFCVLWNADAKIQKCKDRTWGLRELFKVFSPDLSECW